MQLTEPQLAALVTAIIVVLNALAVYLQNQSSTRRSQATQAKIDELHSKVAEVAQVVASPVSPVNVTVQAPPTVLVDGHQVIPHG